MNTTTRISTAERLGRWLGRGWRTYVRGEQCMAAWLVSQGLPTAGATALLWIVKFGVLAVFLYATFWVVLPLAVLAVAAALGVSDAHTEEDEREWSFGGYNLDELRETPGYDPNFYGDVAHPMYHRD